MSLSKKEDVADQCFNHINTLKILAVWMTKDTTYRDQANLKRGIQAMRRELNRIERLLDVNQDR